MLLFWMKIKALNIASKPLCCKCTQKVVNVWILLGFLGSGFLPCSNSSRSMALDNLLLPNLFSVQKRKKQNKQRDRDAALKWWVKSMKKHLCVDRHKRQTVVFSHVKNKTKKQNRKTADAEIQRTRMHSSPRDEALPSKTHQWKRWPVLIPVSFSSRLLPLPSVHHVQTCFG